MLSPALFRGLKAVPFEDYPGVFALEHHLHPGSSRLVSSYADGKRHKPRLFALMARLGQRERRGGWDLHHIVEGQHYADVDFTGQLEQLYKNELPVVLITKDEHVAYNQVLHVRETDLLFRDAGTKETYARADTAHRAAQDRTQHAQLRTTAQRLQSLYREAYRGDRVLSTIAQNVLEDALRHLR